VRLDMRSSCAEFQKLLFNVAYEGCEDRVKVAELHEIFGLIDSDGGGSIGAEEFYELLCLVGMKDIISEEESNDMVASVDEDDTGEIEFGEFLKVMRRKPEHKHTHAEVAEAFENLCLGQATDDVMVGEARFDHVRKWLEAYKPGNTAFFNGICSETSLSLPQVMEMREAFSVFDLNGDGRITTGEIQKVMARMGRHTTEGEVAVMVEAVDEDNSGSIDFAEFSAIMTQKMREVDSEEELREAFQVPAMTD